MIAGAPWTANRASAGEPRHSVVRRLLLLGFAAALTLSGYSAVTATSRSALDYKRTTWTSDEGAPSHIRSITQTADGYLLLGTDSGLYQFDGVRFKLLAPLKNATARSDRIEELLTARNGDVWIGYYYGGVAVYRRGQIRDMNGSLPSGMVRSIAEAADGSIWVAAAGRKMPNLRRFKNGRWIDAAQAFGLPTEAVTHVLGARNGSVWVVTTEHIYVLPPRAKRFQQSAMPVRSYAAGTVGLVQIPDGQLWLSDQLGLRPVQAPGATPHASAPPMFTDGLQPFTMLVADKDGSLWNGDSTRLMRVSLPADPEAVRSAERDRIPASDSGKSSLNALSIFEDREGSLWIGTISGLISLRPSTVLANPKVSDESEAQFRFATDSRGRLFGLAGDGLFELDSAGGPARLRRLNVSPNALCTSGDDGFWILAQHGSILHVRGGRLSALAPPPSWQPYINGNCAEDDQGRLWLSVAHTGVMRWDGTSWARVSVIPGDPTSFPANLSRQPTGDLLMSFTPWRIAEVRGDDVKLQPIAPGLTDIVTFLYKTGGDIFAGSDSGIARMSDGRVSVVTAARFPWVKNARGMTQTADGWTWVANAIGIARVQTRAFQASFDNPAMKVPVRIFSATDGLTGSPLPLIGNSLATDKHQTVWISTDLGLERIVPSMVVENKALPPVVIENVSVDDHSVGSAGSLRLPAGSRNIHIDYTALSLADPRRVEFRYRLDDFDADWVNPEGRRQAVYSELPPGTYKFRVIASNNHGLWNTTGATVTLVIPPTFRQSWWFVFLWVTLIAVVFWALYALRLRQATERMQANERARVAERERIARELHDTLLQSLQGLILRFQSIATRIPRDQAARAELEEALQRADGVVVEGRDSVYGLRSVPSGPNFVEQVEGAVAQIAASQRVFVHAKGSLRPIYASISEEISNIVSEAVRNAARHSQGRSIDVSITFGERMLGVSIIDDGVGIDRKVAATGRANHYGLTGMRERAARIKARLAILPGPGGGTVVRVTVPRGRAYSDLNWWQRLWSRTAEDRVGSDEQRRKKL